jgi:CMP-N-acetylneuraminic acid synthetase
MSSEIVAGVVIAKQFSARLHRKNMQDLCGKPVVEWSFIQGKACQQITHLVFVTDDLEMGEIAKQYTPHVVYQDPARTLPKVASGWIAVNEGLEYLAKEVGEPSIVVALLPTSPLKKRDDLSNLVWTYRKWRQAKGVKLVQPAVRCHELTLHMDLGNGAMARMAPAVAGESRYLNTACIGWNAADFAQYRATWDATTYDDPLVYMELEPWQGFDIDREVDLDIARALFQKYVIDKGGYE